MILFDFVVIALPVALVFLLVALANIQVTTPRKVLGEWHHGYLGFVLGVAGVFLISPELATGGLVILLDDLYQHALQALRRRPYTPDFSPLYRAYVATARWLLARGVRLPWL